MLAVMVLSQYQISSSKTVRHRAPCGARCMEQVIRTWSAVCLMAPHSQFGEGARPYWCMNEWNGPTLVCRRVSLTLVVWSKLIKTGLALVLGMKTSLIDAVYLKVKNISPVLKFFSLKLHTNTNLFILQFFINSPFVQIL